jgi:hypothetical protein
MAMTIKIVSDKEAEKVDFVVCAPVGPTDFTDNLTAFCCKCGTKVMYRWYMPRKPPKICLACANAMPGNAVTTIKKHS